MTRLTDKKNGAGDQAGYNPSIFDYDGSSASNTMKRSRPYKSSLDYKLLGSENPTMYVIPPKQGMTAGRPHPEEQPPQPRKVMTRARGSSGIPPQQLTLEDLQNLDEETLMRVLYENPHLAAEAERLRQQQQHASRGSTGSGSSSSSSDKTDKMTSRMMDRKYHRRSDGSVHKDESNYIEDLRKDGVPVIQWVVLLVLLGALIFQLYKALKGPEKTKKPKKVKGGSSSSSKKTPIDSELERLAEEVGPSVKTKAAPTKKKSAKKKTPVKPKASVATSSAPTDTNGRVKEKVEPFDPAVPALTSDATEAQVDQGGWQVVGAAPKTGEKKKSSETNQGTSTPATSKKTEKSAIKETKSETAPAAKKTNASTSASSAAPKNGSTNGTPKENSPVNESAKKNETTAPSNGNKPDESSAVAIKPPESAAEQAPTGTSSDGLTESGNKKKKNKKKNASKSSPSAETAASTTAESTEPATLPTTDDDAALAQKLQKEEEKLASASSGTKEDAWEEVVVKKRRGKA